MLGLGNPSETSQSKSGVVSTPRFAHSLRHLARIGSFYHGCLDPIKEWEGGSSLLSLFWPSRAVLAKKEDDDEEGGGAIVEVCFCVVVLDNVR